MGWAQFRGRRVSVGPGVFVPRARTEFLVDCALQALAPCGGTASGARAARVARPDRSPVVVDLCCGCGAVGAAIAAERPGIRLHAADISAAATACARHRLAGTGARCRTGDLFEALPRTLCGQVDLLVANAPYVPSDQIPFMPREARDHEPLQALDGGPSGVEVHARIAARAPQWLATGGTLLIESSPALAARTSQVLADADLQVRTLRSVEHDAVVLAARTATPPPELGRTRQCIGSCAAAGRSGRRPRQSSSLIEPMRVRSCITALVCIWQIRLSVTPSTWPISARVKPS